MFSVRYAGNWIMSVTFALVGVVAWALPAVAHASGATVILGQLVAAMALAGVAVLLVNAALRKPPAFDWTAPCGTRLHPRVRTALKGIGLALLSLACLLGYVSIFVFGLYGVLYFGLFMVVVMMSWIIYITAGKHHIPD